MSLAATVIPKSDQMNADDLLTGPKTIRITKVTVLDAKSEQPVHIHYDGDNGKPYKPGKSMRRVLIGAWGDDETRYVGRSLTLYCDPEVKFGSDKTGGIRISHMSHIDTVLTMPLTATRGKRLPFTVKPLVMTSREPEVVYETEEAFQAALRSVENTDNIDAIADALSAKRWTKEHRAAIGAKIKEKRGAK